MRCTLTSLSIFLPLIVVTTALPAPSTHSLVARSANKGGGEAKLQAVCKDNCYLVLPHLKTESKLNGICVVQHARFSTWRRQCQKVRVETAAQGLAISWTDSSVTGTGKRVYMVVNLNGELDTQDSRERVFMTGKMSGNEVVITGFDAFQLKSKGRGGRKDYATIVPVAENFGLYNMVLTKKLDDYTWEPFVIPDLGKS
ncbi:MAG: hypothetical protein M1829_004604 [Trizodia sp. TS-e1964]|nr:MAG: hypothetical protein M1829_004604 [Trizodia sp. TS-e1964]